MTAPTERPSDADDAVDLRQLDAEIEQVRRKAERMRRARRSQLPLWRHLAHVGVLGWLFILPVLGLLLLGRALGRTLDQPLLGIAGLLAGVLLGAYLVWRSVRRSLDEEGDSSPPARDGEDGR